MSAASVPGSLMIAGHPIVALERTGGLLSLRVALQGQSLVEWARTLGKLDGVRVTNGPEGLGRERCFLVHCPGFKVVISTQEGQDADVALALVSRAPQAALAVISDLGAVLEGLITAPPPIAEPEPEPEPEPAKVASQGSSLRRGSSLSRGKPLAQGKPLARTSPLRRKTPLARGSWR
jgi:hypothetical protein